MSERTTNLASKFSVREHQKPNRKERKQISFRVNESEYEKLKQSAETLHMSVPAFVKKKAQGSRLVAPKFDKDKQQSIVKELSSLGNNVNQVAKYCNKRYKEGRDPRFMDLNRNLTQIREILNDIWQQLK
ncbi:TPA: MobC family plasmid mobilization relaxosome protein [Staphylococcus aureus]|nr:mobilization protein [Salmonella enterica subsp. enterica serovar Kentucky]HAC5789036.1 plasmid mobilization relaxosome protein MobC [Listeria monocytogenes]HAU5831776.1 MobC family plasmid mobilization relaxosome protein [Staphylococcus aureus]HAU5847264.1 MobC family plasmid mobilization relaxosome protein [Staphylococcus aureus]HAU5867989.1 MobC family plasmid mobilization relaxosome protein [Staphylococcus aureus]